MSNDCKLYNIDEVIKNGVSLPFEHAKATLDNASRWENEAVAASSGDDCYKGKRVVPLLKIKYLFKADTDPSQLYSEGEFQLVLRDASTGRRGRCGKAVFAKMGAIGDGAVDVEYHLLRQIQWL